MVSCCGRFPYRAHIGADIGRLPKCGGLAQEAVDAGLLSQPQPFEFLAFGLRFAEPRFFNKLSLSLDQPLVMTDLAVAILKFGRDQRVGDDFTDV